MTAGAYLEVDTCTTSLPGKDTGKGAPLITR